MSTNTIANNKDAYIFKAALTFIFIFLTIGGFIVWIAGSTNPETPAGYVGYLTRGAVFGQSEYVGCQTGPTSFGRAWKMNVVNISVTPTTLTETFGPGNEVLSKDQLKLTFAVHTLFRVRPNKVKDLIEKFSTLHEKGDVTEVAFAQFIKESLRTEARQKIEESKAMDASQNLSSMSKDLTAWAKAYTEDTPFEVMNVVVGNIQFPALVADAVSNKLKAEQDIQTLKFELEQEKLRADKRVAEAKGIAEATAIIQQKLTPLYIQHEAIEAQKAMANGQNHSVVYIPVGKGGVPLVSTVSGSVE